MHHPRLALFAFALLGILGSHTANAQFQFDPRVIVLDSLLQTAGPTWREARSRHFVLYAEQGPGLRYSPAALLESLEDAWTHDLSLLGAAVLDRPPITVLVTHSAMRFPGVLVPSSRGVMRQDSDGGQLIILVHNDSIRAFTRHEVMHAVSQRAWGPPGSRWVSEGVATWADSRCQSTTVLAVARDLLRAEPRLTAAGLPAHFDSIGAGPFLGPRLSAYALAASMVGFVYDRGGAAALHALWHSGMLPPTPPLSVDSITPAWRAYVERAAAGTRGLAPAAIEARGCD